MDNEILRLLQKKNVVAVGEGMKQVKGKDTGRMAMVVVVSKKVSPQKLSPDDVIPRQIHGLESDVVEGEMPSALVDRTGTFRPVVGGVSGGHYKITAGTLNVLCKKGVKRIVSNNHVLANSNNCRLGDFILQPGAHDGGTLEDIVGNLEQYVPIVFTDDATCKVAKLAVKLLNKFAEWAGSHHRIPRPISTETNLVDCAVASPATQAIVSEEILEIGIPNGYGVAVVGDEVKKSGRTTGLTHGVITINNAIVKVQFGDKVAVFEDQIITTEMSQGGDSGSLVLNTNNQIVGLLFAGSSTQTIINKIAHVIAALELDVML